MAKTSLEIANIALLKLGERVISSLTEATPNARTMNSLMDTAFADVLFEYNFSDAMVRTTLLSDATYTATDRYPYRYKWPSKILKLLQVFDSDEDQYYNFRKIGSYIYTDISSITILYLRNIKDDPEVSPLIGRVVACYLAYLAAPSLTKEETTAGRLYQEYSDALRKAKSADSQQKGPMFYGPNTPIMADPYQDHPDGWVDR